MFLSATPSTGDAGVNPVVLVLLAVCLLLVIGCIVWAIILNRKSSKIKTTVVTVTDDDEIYVDETLVEEITDTSEDDTASE